MKQGTYIDIYVVMAAMSHRSNDAAKAGIHQELKETLAAYRQTIAHWNGMQAQPAAAAKTGMHQSGAAAAMLTSQQAA